jgi:hypothetical protein
MSSDQFFVPNYSFNRLKESIAESEQEAILAVNDAVDHVEIITNGYVRAQYRLRYKLKVSGNSWKIASVELECGICKGSGKRGENDCKLCSGVGWKLLGESHKA